MKSTISNLFKSKGATQVVLPAEEKRNLKTVAELQQEYTNGCAQLGNLVYSIWTNEKDVELLFDRLRNLNIEGAAAKQAEALAAAEVPAKEGT